MESITILKIRLQGIIGCIDQYTSEPTITTIKDSLETALLENNFEVILFACKEIDKWYEKNIAQVLSNEFVGNKNVHKENCELIKGIITDLEENSEKYADALLALTKATTIKTFGLNDLMNLLDRFHQVVIQLRDRYDNRETLDVNDEYDVQDLLHSLLRIYCDDICPEEWTPSYAGTSSRQDFLLKNEKIVIETKKTRKGLGNKELANKLIIDIAHYKEHPDCKSLVCFVYDPENRIRNPRGFENDLSKSVHGIDIVISIRP
ncbi:hypothetical protein JMF89_18610 [Clostridiaceae bacterium UIB06]|nr:hypothetical protein [Clostridiaceae bacterium UIB06]